MGGRSDFADVDRRAADNFGRAAARAGVQRIVYLGGLTGSSGSLSTHLKSRVETGDVLRASGVPVIEFRASIVIGAGSLSFEMIQALVERLPVMICPRWVATLTQPIAITDVLAYLEAALDLPNNGDSPIFEIGGPEVVSYGGMMREYARLRGLRRLLVPVPLLTPHLSGLWLALVTPAQARVGRALVEGLKNATVVRSMTARDVFRIEPMSLSEALRQAIEGGSRARQKVDTRMTEVDVPPAQAFAPIRRIGGATGWYFGTWLWSVRSALDRLFGGAGMQRGRRDPEHCVEKDVIDGWTVETWETDRRLRLAAGLKLPGRGWLDFEVTPLDDGRRSRIRQTAIRSPRHPGARTRMRSSDSRPDVPRDASTDRRTCRARRSAIRIRCSYRSLVNASAEALFRWHERPEAILDLIRSPTRPDRKPDRRFARRRPCEFSIGAGPLRLWWEARHYGYVRANSSATNRCAGHSSLEAHAQDRSDRREPEPL